jgi:hypothetical protein
MAIVKRIMANTSEIDLGVTYAREFPVDDNATTTGALSGMEWGSLMAVKGDGTSVYFYDDNATGVGATAIKADADDETKEATGILVTTSNKDLYAGLDLTNKLIMKPFGTDSENMTTPMVKKVRVHTYNTTAPKTAIFNTVTTALTGTVAIGGTTAVTGTGTAFTTELTVGDLIEVDSEIREVLTITNDTAVVVSVAFADTATGKTAYQWTDYNRPVYLSTTAGDYTKILPITGFKQEVGRIVSGNHVNIDIKPGVAL